MRKYVFTSREKQLLEEWFQGAPRRGPEALHKLLMRVWKDQENLLDEFGLFIKVLKKLTEERRLQQ